MPLNDFIAELQKNNVEVKLNQASTGTISGISFSMNDVSFKGSKLGKGFTWNALKQKGLYYENGYVTGYEPISNADRQKTGNTSETNDISTINSSNPDETASPLERTGNNRNAAGENNEIRFANELENAEEVAVYAKLPRDFKISTPVGDYTPDWAIAFEKGTVKHVFFIAATKGNLDPLDLRPIEKAKITCAKKLFNELSTSKVRYHEATNYQNLLEVMGKIE